MNECDNCRATVDEYDAHWCPAMRTYLCETCYGNHLDDRCMTCQAGR